MEKLKSGLKVVFSNFGPIVIFYIVNHFAGLKAAIAASTAYSVVEIAYKIYKKEKLSPLFIFSAIVTLIFGAVDLYSQQSFLFKYEPSITNVFTAIFFASTLFTKKSVIQEFAEQRKDANLTTPQHIAYFRLLTIVWVIYFLLKAAVYFVMASQYTLEEGLIIRTVLGSGSFYAMLAISIFGSKFIFPALKRWNLV